MERHDDLRVVLYLSIWNCMSLCGTTRGVKTTHDSTKLFRDEWSYEGVVGLSGDI